MAFPVFRCESAPLRAGRRSYTLIRAIAAIASTCCGVRSFAVPPGIRSRGYVRDAVANRGRPLQAIARTPHTERAAIQDVRVDHRGADVRVAEQLLNGSDVVPVLEEVRRKGMTQRILTLPMNRLPRSFSTVTILSAGNT
jgi:hypothetical protein